MPGVLWLATSSNFDARLPESQEANLDGYSSISVWEHRTFMAVWCGACCQLVALCRGNCIAGILHGRKRPPD